jgi:hypothetical protein
MQFSPGSDPQDNGTEAASISALVNALEAFACAETLDDTLSVLEEQQVTLLSPDALITIQKMIDDMFANGQSADAKNWRQYLHLLKDARQRGIVPAWHYFIVQQKDAAQALEALTAAMTHERLYQTVIDYQHALLSDAALVMLANNIQRQPTHAPPEAVEYWQHLLYLLEDAQVHGIAAAWETFEAQ